MAESQDPDNVDEYEYRDPPLPRTSKEPYPDGSYLVIRASDLPIFTNTGWRVVEVLPPPPQAKAAEYQVAPPSATYTVAPLYVVDTPDYKFLVYQTREAAEAQLAREQEALKPRLDSLNAEHHALLAKHNALVTDHEKLVESTGKKLRDQDTYIKSLETKAGQHGKEMQTLAATLGKVWRHFGDMTMKRILGDAASNPAPPSDEEVLDAYKML